MARNPWKCKHCGQRFATHRGERQHTSKLHAPGKRQAATPLGQPFMIDARGVVTVTRPCTLLLTVRPMATTLTEWSEPETKGERRMNHRDRAENIVDDQHAPADSREDRVQEVERALFAVEREALERAAVFVEDTIALRLIPVDEKLQMAARNIRRLLNR